MLIIKLQQDAFVDNFLLDWMPESLREGHVPVCHPRVYLIDFELAISFPQGHPPDQCVTKGTPIGDIESSRVKPQYNRLLPDSLAQGSTFNAYQLDVWQLSRAFSPLKAGIPSVPIT